MTMCIHACEHNNKAAVVFAKSNTESAAVGLQAHSSLTAAGTKLLTHQMDIS